MSSLYLAGKRQFAHDEQLARLQENGRYAMAIVRRELQMAGFYGGLPSSRAIVSAPVATDCGAEPWALQTSTPLLLSDDHPGTGNVVTTAGDELTCIAGSDVAPATDILAVRRTAAEPTVRDGFLASRMASFKARRWYLSVSPQSEPGWRRLSAAELRASAGAGEAISLWEAVAKIFYVRTYSDPENRDDSVPSLCVEQLVNEAMSSRCFVEGVENMQFELGVDTDKDGVINRYLDPDQVGDVEGVLVARVHLLLRSIDPTAGLRLARSYRLGRTRVRRPADGYIRRVFSTTIQLRNLHRHVIPVAGGEQREPV
jgi:hypothetical protein